MLGGRLELAFLEEYRLVFGWELRLGLWFQWGVRFALGRLAF